MHPVFHCKWQKPQPQNDWNSMKFMSSPKMSRSRVVAGLVPPSAQGDFWKLGFFSPFPSAILSYDIWNLIWFQATFSLLGLGKKFPSVLPRLIDRTHRYFPRTLEDEGGTGRLLSELEAEQINTWQLSGHPVRSKSEQADCSPQLECSRHVWSN